jgi:hypothetical protein
MKNRELLLIVFIVNKSYLKKKNNCPRCKNKVQYFQPARMMDKFTSNQDFLTTLLNSFNKMQKLNPEIDLLNMSDFSNNELERSQKLIENLILKIQIYGIDLKEVLIQYYRQIHEFKKERDNHIE